MNRFIIGDRVTIKTNYYDTEAVPFGSIGIVNALHIANDLYSVDVLPNNRKFLFYVHELEHEHISLQQQEAKKLLGLK